MCVLGGPVKPGHCLLVGASSGQHPMPWLVGRLAPGQPLGSFYS
jgi:hypothetical protein